MLSDTVYSNEALQNPYNYYMTLSPSFLWTDYLGYTITDTHFAQRDRQGRLLAFMARLYSSWGVRLPQGIGLDEQTAMAIDEKGIAHVFSNTSGTAYFGIQYHSDSWYPEVCREDNPLTWYRDRQAVQIYAILGTPSGSNWFDLTKWDKLDSGNLFWYAKNGQFGTYVP